MSTKNWTPAAPSWHDARDLRPNGPDTVPLPGLSMTVANYIERDLTARIVAGRDLPAELSLQALSVHYGVSFTPVRAALRKLIEAGYVERQSNGRVVVVPRPKK